MDGGRLRSMIRGLRRAVDPAGAGGLSDADLLRRWVVRRDEAAFEALLWRHAAAVLGLCRRVLGDAHEAEDASQAAFLALARKARSIGRRQAVAAWLYTVAYRTALRARDRRARRGARPACDLDALPARPAEDPSWRDLRPVLDEEVSRLPEKYRAPFVLCHVEGRTNEEAARELGCPVGTILSRLARARQRLRDRLTRRGVTLTAGVLAAVVVPGAVVRAAVRAAALAAAGQSLAGVVSTEVVVLTEGVVRAMLLTKVKVVAVVVLGLVLLGGGGVLGYRTVAGEPGDGAAGQAQRKAPTDEEKLKAQLAQKEKEVSDLQVRVKALEESLKEKTRQLELALAESQDQAARARAAELEAREQAAAERQARKLAEDRSAKSAAEVGRSGPPPGGSGGGARPEAPDGAPTADGGRAPQAEQARDEVELLEAQLMTKRALLQAAKLSLAPAEKAMAAGNVSQLEVAKLAGDVEVKAAELKESEVRLAQAKRRLAKFQGPAEPAKDPRRQQLGERAADLEKRLDSLKKELDALRKELDRR